jgi:DNA modification methylase
MTTKIEPGHIYLGDCNDLLDLLESESVELIVTDPPYGISFLGRVIDWDKAVIPLEVCKKCFRVLKNGQFMLVMCFSRGDVLEAVLHNLREAGFITGLPLIFWSYSSGFNKSQNASKKADKRAGVSGEIIGVYERPDGTSRNYKGWKSKAIFNQLEEQGRERYLPVTEIAMRLYGSFTSFQPKPSAEVVIVVRKPIGKVHRSDLFEKLGWQYYRTQWIKFKKTRKEDEKKYEKHEKRFNIEINHLDEIWVEIALDPSLSDRVIHVSAGGEEVIIQSKGYKDTDITSDLSWALLTELGVTWLDSGKIPVIEELDDYETRHSGQGFRGFAKDGRTYTNVPFEGDNKGRVFPQLLVSDAILDDGNEYRTGDIKPYYNEGKSEVYGGGKGFMQGEFITSSHKGDTGGFSRFFSLDAWWNVKFPEFILGRVSDLPDQFKKTFPFIIVSKPSKKEKNAGLETKNEHPTIKPIKLMQVLVEVFSRKGQVVLDPYMGSGTTGIACELSGRRYIGFEVKPNYKLISDLRVLYHSEIVKKRKKQEEELKKFTQVRSILD